MIPSDAMLVRYVLGTLPADEAERLDELSIADGDVAARLRGVEHDLADAYARGELSGDDRRRWEERYLATRWGRDELRFAEALVDARGEAPVFSDSAAGPSTRSFGAGASSPRFWPYGLAAAAVVLLAVAAAFVLTRPQRTAAPGEAERSRSPAAAPAPAAGGPPSFVALTLAAPRRDLVSTPVLTIPPGTDEARLTLRLEPNAFDRFAVEIRSVTPNHALWQTHDVAAMRDTAGRSIAIAVPVAALRAGRCVIQVSGETGRRTEILGEYPLAIVMP